MCHRIALRQERGHDIVDEPIQRASFAVRLQQRLDFVTHGGVGACRRKPLATGVPVKSYRPLEALLHLRP